MTQQTTAPCNHGYFKFINLWQTKEERQQKYHLALSCGAHPGLARRMRDWRLSKIERLYGLNRKPEQPHLDLQFNSAAVYGSEQKES